MFPSPRSAQAGTIGRALHVTGHSGTLVRAAREAEQEGKPIVLTNGSGASAAHRVRDVLARADALRIAGRWDDARALLRDIASEAALAGDEAQARRALALAQVLADQEIFAGTKTGDERKQALDEAMACAEAADSDALRAAVWDAMGNSLHASFVTSTDSAEDPDELAYFERGLSLRRTLGAPRDIAESLFHVGLVYGVVREDDLAAMPYFEEADDLARQAGDILLRSYTSRHLAASGQAAGDEAAARAGFAESLRLREEAGFVPGIAFALLPVADAALADGDRETALGHYRRARDIFASLDLPERVAWVDELLAQAG